MTPLGVLIISLVIFNAGDTARIRKIVVYRRHGITETEAEKKVREFGARNRHLPPSHMEVSWQVDPVDMREFLEP